MTAATENETMPAPAPAYPRSVLIYFDGEHEDDEAASSAAADAKTTAAAQTSGGHPFRVSFCFAPPPELSFLLVRFPDGANRTEAMVMAAHGDSVLFQIRFMEGYEVRTFDHFVYNAGANPRPPMVSLLPPYYDTEEELAPVFLDPDATGLLRCGEDEFMVAELTMVDVEDDKKEAKLLRFRSGEWSIRWPTIVSHGATGEEGWNNIQLQNWETRCVLALRDGLLCWVDVSRGLLFSNLFEDSPELRYMPLPAKPYWSNVCVTAGGSAVKFVTIFPRCCCGYKGVTDCCHSHHAYTIHTWTMRIDDMAWVMDGLVDSTEIWALDRYKGLPRVPLVCPFVSLDDPHIICFTVCEMYEVENGDATEWLIMLDLRSKALLSACRSNGSYGGGYGHCLGRNVISTGISDRFNPCPSSNGSSSMTKSHVNIVAPSVKMSPPNTDESYRQFSCKTADDPATQGSEILEVLQEIPSYGLAPEDVLKVISILSQDNGRRFKSILKLPVSLRKNWLLMETKVTEA